MAGRLIGRDAAQRLPEPDYGAEGLGGEYYGRIGWRRASAVVTARDDQAVRLARGLGWFSIMLGVTQVAAPRWLGRQIGVSGRPWLMRLLGVREITTGAAVLSQRHPRAAMWGRVAGDCMDLAMLGASYPNSPHRKRVLAAAGAVCGVALIDAYTAKRL